MERYGIELVPRRSYRRRARKSGCRDRKAAGRAGAGQGSTEGHRKVDVAGGDGPGRAGANDRFGRIDAADLGTKGNAHSRLAKIREPSDFKRSPAQVARRGRHKPSSG